MQEIWHLGIFSVFLEAWKLGRRRRRHATRVPAREGLEEGPITVVEVYRAPAPVFDPRRRQEGPARAGVGPSLSRNRSPP